MSWVLFPMIGADNSKKPCPWKNGSYTDLPLVHELQGPLGTDNELLRHCLPMGSLSYRLERATAM
jgi:hypothetical protein